LKKALVLALTAFMVLALATAALAVDITYEGNVKVKWGNHGVPKDDKTTFATDSLEYKLKFNLVKDFGDGVSAGLTLENKYDNDDNGKEVYDKDLYIVDKNAWIKLDYELFDVTAFTNGNGSVGKDFGQFDLGRNAGVQVDLALIDGLTVTGLASGGGDPTDKTKAYGFLVKGNYAADLFTLGGGFQTESTEIEDVKKTALAAYGSFNVMDNLTVKGEYGSRKLGAKKDEKAITGILAGAKYDDSVLMLDGNFLSVDKGFDIIDYPADGDRWKARDTVKDAQEWKASVIYVDASYAITDALKVVGNFDYILNAKDADNKDVKFENDLKGWNISYKAGAEYLFTEALKGEGWFRAYGKDRNQVGAKATYTFVKGVEGIFELTNESTGVKDADRITKYKAVLAATF